MKFISQAIEGAYVIQTPIFEDHRGLFRRHFCKNELKNIGIDFDVAQGNISENFAKHTLRGFHYSKLPSREDKVLSCVTGSFWNVIIDVRENSGTFMKTVELEISAENRLSLFVPAGCANAFLSLEDNTIAHYYMGEYFGVASDSGFRYDDPQFNIKWPHKPKIISEKDMRLPNFQLGG